MLSRLVTNEPLTSVHEGLMNLDAIELPDNARTTCAARCRSRKPSGRVLERGVAPRDIHYEAFGPDLWQADLD